MNWHLLSLFFFAAMGAFANWLTLKYGMNFASAFEDFFDAITTSEWPKILFVMVAFASFGSVVAVLLVGPNTGRQALAGGMAWTTLLNGITKAAAARPIGKDLG